MTPLLIAAAVLVSSVYVPDRHAEQALYDAQVAVWAVQAEAWADRPEPEPDGGIADHWLELADCESGSWDRHGQPIPGSRRWDYGAPGGFTHEGFEQYHGGLNFHPDTYEWVAGDLGLLDRFPHAYDAPPDVQVQVGAEVQARQGWKAWPICSRKVGLR